MSEGTKGGAASRSKKWLKTGIFAAGMAVILGVAVAVSLLDTPPVMPADETHVVIDKFPNKACLECHAPDSLPNSHPIEYERFACTRCHQQTQKTAPPGVTQ
ncbi:MAG: hypothetical protein ABIJ09_14005 [Pseudomonadota bacterium]